MIKILIIADDFTGALDTGVKFAESGAKTKVMTSWTDNFVKDSSEVLVLCAPTRHESPLEAYKTIRKIVETASGKVGCIFKKTDSALRGNIGAELSAALDGSGQKELYFIPALPAMKRFTSSGVHYIDGIEVQDSVFGKDPFEPVTVSYVPDLIHLQTRTKTESVWAEDAINEAPKAKRDETIFVYDCVSSEEMEAEVATLCKDGIPPVVAGCSGLAEALSPYLGLSQHVTSPKKKGTLVTICGSVNPVSSAQMDFAEKNGFSRIHLTSAQLLENSKKLDRMAKGLVLISESGNGLLVDTLNAKHGMLSELPDDVRENMRAQISTKAGMLIKDMCDAGLDSRLMIIGGDTLLAFANAIGCSEYYPICEVAAGVVLFKVMYEDYEYEIISKSGGFGSEDLLVQIVNGDV